MAARPDTVRNGTGSFRPRIPRWLPFCALIGGCAAVGFGLAANAIVANFVLGLTALIAMQVLGWRRLALLMIAATFVTRWRIPIPGMNILVEHALLGATLLALFLAGKSSQVLSAIREPSVILFGLFVLWSFFVSSTRSPNASASLEIVGWLVLDWVMLAVLVASFPTPSDVVSAGAGYASLAAAAAIGMWIVSQVSGSEIGVQFESQTGSSAVYGLSFEANLLASALGIWTFLALSVSSVSWRTRWVTVVLSLSAIALTLTRAVLVGLAGGLLIWALFGVGSDRRRVLKTLFVAALLAVSFIVLAPAQSSPFISKTQNILDFKDGNGALRVREWTTAVADLQGIDWLIGLGTNSFGQRHRDPTRPLEPRPAYLGNLPLQVLYDTGLIGVLLLGSGVLLLLPVDRRKLARACGLIVLFMASAIATSPFWFGSSWLLIALGVMDRRTERAKVNSDLKTNATQSPLHTHSIQANLD